MKYKHTQKNKTTIYEIGKSTQDQLRLNNKLITTLCILITISIILLLFLISTGKIGNYLSKAIC